MSWRTLNSKSSDFWKISDLTRSRHQFEAKWTRSSTTSTVATTSTASSSSCRSASPQTKSTNASGYLLRYVKNASYLSYQGLGFKKKAEVALVQAWATSGPRATCGPPSILMWPASYVESFLTSYFDIESMLKIQEMSSF